MDVYYSHKIEKKPSAVALGFFDGVHMGHRQLISHTVSTALLKNAEALVYTFSSHPLTHLKKVTVPLISTNEERARLFEELGVGTVIFDPFPSVSDMPPREFVEKVLVDALDAIGVVCGYNFRFGKDNSGDVDTLRSLLAEHRIPLTVIPPICAGDEPVSSGRIRALIEEGSVESARTLLCRPFRLEGEVVGGKGIGRTLGFPTANIALPEGVITPRRGVYYTLAEIDGVRYPAVTNIGVRPTVGDGMVTPVCETHVIDKRLDLYGAKMTVLFYANARPEQTFGSLGELSQALEKDVLGAKKYFDSEDTDEA